MSIPIMINSVFMKKKSIIIAMMLFPICACGQNIWEQQNHEQSESNAASKHKADKKYIDMQIMADENGNLAFEHKIQIKGKSRAEILSAVKKYLDVRCSTNEERYSGKNNVMILDESEGIVVAKFSEEIQFSLSKLARDFTRFNYKLVVKCNDNEMNVTVMRMSYDYEEKRNKIHLTAEETITDSEALNKKRSKMYNFNAKFRRKTIDWRDSLFEDLDKNFEIR